MDEKKENTNLGNLEKEANLSYLSKSEWIEKKQILEKEPWDYEYFISFLGDEKNTLSAKNTVISIIEKYNPPVYFEALKYTNSIILRFNDQNPKEQLNLLESIKNLENCRVERGSIYNPLGIEDISCKE